MKSRITRCAALVGIVLSLSSFAQDCQEISLYKNGENGTMVESTRTFPEAPEWKTNWGEMDGMVPPYIRLSGMKDKTSDWTGNLTFETLPKNVRGVLKLKVRSTQSSKFGVWVSGSFGTSQIHFQNLEANKTTPIQVDVSSLIGVAEGSVNKVSVGLFDVPAYQYTTLFMDDIAFSCSGEAATPAQSSVPHEGAYAYDLGGFDKASREGKFLKGIVRETSAAYDSVERKHLKDSTDMDFVLSEEEHRQIVSWVNASTLTAEKSHRGWFRNMFFVERNRLRDSVIANPKFLFYEAKTFAAGVENQELPVLIGNVDYGYRVCADSACSKKTILKSRVLQAGLPTVSVGSSMVRLHYDPYFVSTNRKSLPQLEIYANQMWNALLPGESLLVEFESAGLQKVQVRLAEGGLTVKQNLFVEVK